MILGLAFVRVAICLKLTTSDEIVWNTQVFEVVMSCVECLKLQIDDDVGNHKRLIILFQGVTQGCHFSAVTFI